MGVPAEIELTLTEWLGPGWSATPLFGDASVRAYFRIRASEGGSYILCVYPEEVRRQLKHVVAAHGAASSHAPLPALLRIGESALLQQDVGDRTLFDVLCEDAGEGRKLYAAAVDALVAFQRSGDPGLNPPFTSEFFFGELVMAREYYAERLMQSPADPESFLKIISDIVAAHPYRLCHRDYHGQNIHIFNKSVFIIDYQDMRLGPDTYDLASLLRDRGVAERLGRQTEMDLVERYRVRAALSGDVRRRYFECLLQRSIKILGTFSRQAITRGRMHYLDFIPAALAGIERCLEELPSLAPLRDIFPLRFDLEAARQRAASLTT
jgi:aminoglycoside/choline kinase family phosphotransferase